MNLIDWVVLAAYCLGMLVIGILCMLRIRHQEDYFLGGRSFGKVMQAFAAFGAGTGADNPVTLGRTVYTSGLSGIWSVLLWLFVTPFYWFYGVWYRRMRHLTIGDWFTERYESRGLGAAYAIFGFLFYMVYLSVGFSAISKVCEPLLGVETVHWSWLSSEPIPIANVLVPIVALVVIVYGVAGGLRAAYWTDLIQGIFILLLSVMLIPFGLRALVAKFGDPETMGLFDGFRIMHEQVAPENFQIIESPLGGEFPLHYIIAITVINMIGIVVQPHFIATGGGSAKTEMSARVGLVAGNFLKRLCTVGWALTSLIVLALLAGDSEIARDPDSVWGIASVRILAPLGVGLVGLMLACLLAALMSSADCYMLVVSGLFVRNIYAAFIEREASEKRYVFVGRVFSFAMIIGAVYVSLAYQDVFEQLKITWEMTAIFAAAFWVGLFWRRASRAAAWLTVAFTAIVFFIGPMLLPYLWPNLRTDPRFLTTNGYRTTIVTRDPAPADIRKREADIAEWIRRREEIDRIGNPAEREKALAKLGARPEPYAPGDKTREEYKTGGKAIYWSDGVAATAEGLSPVEVERRATSPNAELVIRRWADDAPREGRGFFNFDFLAYDLLGVDLANRTNAELESLRLPPRIITPFLVMVLLSFITRPIRKERLDRYYAKMRTPVEPDPDLDRKALEAAWADPAHLERAKLFPGTNLEFGRPTWIDITGFVLSFLGTFGIIWLAVWVAGIGA